MLEILEPGLKQWEFSATDKGLADQGFIAKPQVVGDAVDAKGKLQSVQSFGNLAIVQIAWNFVGEIANQAVVVAQLIDVCFME